MAIELNPHERRVISDLVAEVGVDRAADIIIGSTRKPAHSDEGMFIGPSWPAYWFPHECKPERNQKMQGYSCTECGTFLCGDEQIERLKPPRS